jgi:hypothetical protein
MSSEKNILEYLQERRRQGKIVGFGLMKPDGTVDERFMPEGGLTSKHTVMKFLVPVSQLQSAMSGGKGQKDE